MHNIKFTIGTIFSVQFMCIKYIQLLCIIVALICISLMTDDIEHLSLCLLAICISSLEKCLCKFFTHFLIVLFVLLKCNYSLYSLDNGSLSDKWLANIVSHSVGFLFTFWVVFSDAEVLNFDEVQFI